MVEVWALESQVGKGNMTQDDPNYMEVLLMLEKVPDSVWSSPEAHGQGRVFSFLLIIDDICILGQ